MGLSVGAVARRLGVAPSTLRTWGRRYGIGPSRHSAGGHRRYDTTDVARLQLMNQLILDGTPPEEAARKALAAAPEDLPAQPPPQQPEPRPAWGSGGQRLAVTESTPATRALARAAMGMDAVTMQRLIDEALRRDGVVQAWQELFAPVLIGIGERHAETGAIVEIEHLLSGTLLSALAREVATAGPPITARPVVLACAAEEQHSLPVYALAASLAAERIAVRVLGARMPYEALAAAIRHLGPAAVFVWSQTPDTGDPAPLAGLPGGRPRVRLLAGGPGWADDRLPERVHRVGTLPEAIAEVHAAYGHA
ncbi:MerR family transcriptional regulator [Actinomadura barringtoniae]|uniref:MerR family transcriptional regulator n=1 Tax=Actinomadura barringtoniae TaxID=1427535 RepID=UPI0027DC28C5|nr:MerR family transcriptional regulator [Actinomadura barringtoniae]